MTYKINLDQIINAESPENWAYHCSYMIEFLLKTAHLALENETSGMFNDEEVKHMTANTIEVALALLVVVNEGAEKMERKHNHGVWRAEAAE